MGLTTGNTFSLTLANPTSQATTVSLFRQGFAPSTSYVSRNLRQGAFDDSSWLDFSTLTLIRPCTFSVFTSFGGTLLIQTPTLAVGTTLAQINEAYAAATFLTPQPDGAFVRLFFDGDSKVYTQCVGMNFANGNITSVNADGTAINGILTNLGDHILSPFSTAELINGSYSYSELMATQTGSPMQIVALDIDTTNTLQFSSPIEYARYDANGNVKGQAALGLIDPYQFQTEHLVNIPLEGLVFDGNSQLNYLVNAFTTVQLTFRYVFAAEGMLFSQAIRQQILDQYRKAQQDMIDLSNGLKKELLL